jgi:hypothetical protein
MCVLEKFSRIPSRQVAHEDQAPLHTRVGRFDTFVKLFFKKASGDFCFRRMGLIRIKGLYMNQCCGSRMFNPGSDYWSIPDPDPGSGG